MDVVFPEKLLDYEWLLHYSACISLCSADYKHDLMALLLRWVELRGQGTRLGKRLGEKTKRRREEEF